MHDSLLGRQFVHTLCDVCFVDKHGKGKFFPYFCPMSLFGTCCIVGRIHSLLEREEKICCEMGQKGMLCCLFSMPISFFGPFGGSVYFCFLSNTWRDAVKRDYNVIEEKTGILWTIYLKDAILTIVSAACCFGHCPSLWFGMHYPWYRELTTVFLLIVITLAL